MKKENQIPEEGDNMLPEYGFTGKKGVRGKYFLDRQQGHTVQIVNEDGTVTVQHFGPTITLDADVAEYFPDAESVNKALRALISIFLEMQANQKKHKSDLRKQNTKPPAARK